MLLIAGEGKGFLTGRPERVLNLSFQGQALKSVNKTRPPETRSLQRFHPTRWIFFALLLSAVFRVQARSKQLPNICSSSTTRSTRTSEPGHAN